MAKKLKKEFDLKAERQLSTAQHLVKTYLKNLAVGEYASDETTIKVHKGKENVFNEEVIAASPYIIEIERQIGTNIAKDESFADHLKGLFGRKNVEFEATRFSGLERNETTALNPQREKVVFAVSGDDLTMKKRVETRIEAAAKMNARSKFGGPK